MIIFDNENDNRLQIFLFFQRARLFYSHTQRRLQNVVRGFLFFCFSYVREIKMTSFSYFSNYFKIIYHEFI